MKKNRTVRIILAAAGIIVIVAVLFLASFLLPGRMKGLLARQIEKSTGCYVTIGSARYLPLTHYYFKDVRLYKDELSGQILASADEISFSVKLWPFIRGKSVIARVDVGGLRYRGLNLSGSSSIYLKDLRSPARRNFLEKMDGIVALKGLSIAIDGTPYKIEDFNGSINLKDNTVKLGKTTFILNGVTYRLDGALSELDTDRPAVNISLESEALKMDSSMVIADDLIRAIKISGSFYGSMFKITGSVKNLSPPDADLYCEARLELPDIERLMPHSEFIAKTLKPRGQCVIAAVYNGPLDDPARAEASLKVSSNSIGLFGVQSRELYLDLRMLEGRLSAYRFTSRPYSGLFEGSLDADISAKGFPFSFNLALKDADLGGLSQDLKLEKQKLSGLISSKFFIQGNAASADSLRGSGWVTVTDGRLWDLPLLGGVTELLAAPSLKSVTFKEAAGNFVVDERRISTEDLTFYSEKVNIQARGFVDFDKRIDFMLTTNITQDVVEGSSDIANIANILISEAGNYMGKIRVTGTIDKPKFNLNAKPMGDLFKKEIKGLLRNILQ